MSLDGREHAISDAQLELVVACMRTLAHPTRIKLLLALEEASRSVQALADAVEISQQNASKHLLALHRTGVIIRQLHGREVLYSLADQDTIRLVAAVRSLALHRLQQRADEVLQASRARRASRGKSDAPP